ncbi:MAG: hypothetical protein OEY51_12615 [Cyclobacteriaceae bacterium]|nr:hypothetical protein [Cyclobacteriaceae bacterium]
MPQKLPSIFKTARHQRFHLSPRYYDPVREDIQRREKNIKRQHEAGNENKEGPDLIQGSFKRYTSKTNSQSTLIRLIIIFLLLVAVLILFY